MLRLDHGRSRWALGALVVAGSMIAAACGSSSDSSTADEPVGTPSTEMNSEPATVVSDDGMLMLDVPAGAIPEGTAITARRLEGAGSFDVGVELVSPVYELEPAGLRFAEPVTVEVLVPERDEWAGGLPVAFGALSSDGTFEPTGPVLAARRDGDVVLMTTVEHFSEVTFFDRALTLRLEPASYRGSVGSKFFADSLLFRSAGVDEVGVNFARDDEYSGEGGVTFDRFAYSKGGEFECSRAPGGAYVLDVTLATGVFRDLQTERELSAVFGDEFVDTQFFGAELRGEATCLGPNGADGGDTESDGGDTESDGGDTESDGGDTTDSASSPTDDEPAIAASAPGVEWSSDVGGGETVSSVPQMSEVPAAIAIESLARKDSLWTMLAGSECDTACFDSLEVFGAQLFFVDETGRILGGMILQYDFELNEWIINVDGNAGTAVDDIPSEFLGNRWQFGFDPNLVEPGSAVKGAITVRPNGSDDFYRVETTYLDPFTGEPVVIE